ncbi:MAG: GntR family transcriptional regulator [Deltaproteobacteria bacterium]|jgi:DNA-binding GntR family transcriptional regulator|nr:GntR family transcriptional regulator [Deltaproteobacteria bacterium]
MTTRDDNDLSDGSSAATVKGGPSNKDLPAYRALALALKEKIANGEYALGEKIPSELAISREKGLSIMTVRQSVGLLVQAGILKRIQGSGTFVVTPIWTEANFGLNNLTQVLADRRNLSLSIIKARLASAGPKTAAHLQLDPQAQVIFQDRLIRYKSQPILLNHSAIRFDPFAPVVEAELEHVGLFNVLPAGQAQKKIKKSLFRACPVVLAPEEASRLHQTAGDPALKIVYTIYDYEDRPLGSGWLLASRKLTQISGKVGFWE